MFLFWTYSDNRSKPRFWLKNVNFGVEKGEFVAILGPLGFDKTTLMNIIGCMDVADSGEYYLDGQPIHSMTEK